MDFLFRNSYVRNEEIVKEFCSYNSYKKPFAVIRLIVIALLFVFGLATVFLGEYVGWVLSGLCVLDMVYIAVHNRKSIKTIL